MAVPTPPGSAPRRRPAPAPTPSRIFCKRLRGARESRGFSQADLAQRTGLQQSALSHYENGARRPSFSNLRKLATALDVTTDYLVGQAPPGTDDAHDLARQIGRLRPADREIVRSLVASLLRRRR